MQVPVGDVMVIVATEPVRKEDELCLSYMSGRFKHLYPDESQSGQKKKGTSTWGFECACGVCERLGARARECDAARTLLGSSNDVSVSVKELAARTGKMRALALAVPDARSHTGEAQPHLAAMLNIAASEAASRPGRTRNLSREAVALLRESIEICPPEVDGPRAIGIVLPNNQRQHLTRPSGCAALRIFAQYCPLSQPLSCFPPDC